MDDVNSFDDQYLSSADLFHLLESLDYFINCPEGMWKDVPLPERELWRPYRELRARLQERIGMRMWDDADKWLDLQLHKERGEAVQAFRRKMEELLGDPKLSRNLLRDGVQRIAEELYHIRFTKAPPRADEMDEGTAFRDRTRQPFRSDNWRRRQASYREMNQEEEAASQSPSVEE